MTKNVALHKKHIDSDIEEFHLHWHDEECFKAGVTIADLIYYAVGPVHGKHSEIENPVGFEGRSIPLFTGGFIKGFVIKNDLEEYETCYTDIRRWFLDTAKYAHYLGEAKLGLAIFWFAKAWVDLHPLLFDC